MQSPAKAWLPWLWERCAPLVCDTGVMDRGLTGIIHEAALPADKLHRHEWKATSWFVQRKKLSLGCCSSCSLPDRGQIRCLQRDVILPLPRAFKLNIKVQNLKLRRKNKALV